MPTKKKSKHSSNMEAHDESYWLKIKVVLDKIFAEERQPVVRREYMSIYDLIHGLCTGKGNDSNQYKKRIYDNVHQYLENYNSLLLERGNQFQDEESLLKFFTRQWNEYKFSARVLHGMLEYINRYYVNGYGNKTPGDIYKLAKISWSNNLLKEFGKKVIGSVLKLITKDRDGEQINGSLISSVIDCYVELNDVNDGENNKVYEEGFVKPLLENTFNYYSIESQQFLEHNSFDKYLKRCSDRFEEESKRCILYLNKNLKEPLIENTHKAMVSKHMEKFEKEFKSLLKDNQIEELKLLYNLLRRNSSELESISEVFNGYVKKVGEESISRHEASSPQSIEDFVGYINSILEVFHRYKNLIEVSFASDCLLVAAFDKACESFINSNAVTSRTSYKKSPELLAKFCDHILKKTNKDYGEAELENRIVDAVNIFKYVQDKDVFHTFYIKMLTNRMLMDNSVGKEAEVSLLTKLKETCGVEYTSKMQRILQDIVDISKDLNEKFRQGPGQFLKVDFSVKVISQSVAPFTAKVCEFLLPQELENCISQFTAYYIAKHNGKTLQWNYNLSRGDITFTGLNKTYMFQTSTFQMCILLQYNEHTCHTVEFLEKATGIELSLLVKILSILLRTKLLVCKNLAQVKEVLPSQIKPEMLIELNEKYNNKKLRLNINLPIKSDVKEDEEKTYKEIECQRKFIIQAAIVRIMKTRKSLSHKELINQVLDQLKAQFTTTVVFIKQQIQDLMEKEYLKRSDADQSIYEYLA